MSKLQRFLQDREISVAAFADGINVHLATAYKYINGGRIPDREVMPRIVEWSGGELTPNDFYDLPAPEPRPDMEETA